MVPRTAALLLSAAFAASAAAQTQPTQAPSTPAAAPQPARPQTDVFVATLSRNGDGFAIGKPQNISSSPGYDNQPFFAPDGVTLYFTSDRGPTPSTGARQTDIYRHDGASGTVSRVTDTPESEYSPTVMPDGQHISVIRVEADQTQRLWRFSRSGESPALVLKDVKPVGYHAWLSETALALFVLGPPATLQLADTTTGKAEVVATNIGPSVQKMPRGGASFVQLGGGADRTFIITQLTLADGKPVTRPLTSAVPGATEVHVAWAPDGTLLMAHGGSLHAWRQGDTAWRAVADLNALGLKGVTRLAVSPKGDRIAFVGTN